MSLSERIEERASDVQSRRVTYPPVAKETPAATRTVRMMTYNILSGGWPRIDHLEAVMRAARADVIGMQEVEERTLVELAHRLGMVSAFSPSRRGSHVGLLSRWPLLEACAYPQAPMHNALLQAVVAPDGVAPIRIFVAHLAAQYAAWRAGEAERLRELRFILDQMRPARDAGEPHLLMGDFNSLAPDERLLASRLLLHTAHNDQRRVQEDDALLGLPGIDRVLPRPLRPLASALLGVARLPALSRAADAVAGVYVPRAVVRQTRAAGYTDLYTVGRSDPQLRGMSCPTSSPAGRIDYIFASPALVGLVDDCDLVGDAPDCPITRASDHAPTLATLALPTR